MPLMVGIAGPSCSGKSSVCEAIATGREDVELLSLDDFFVEKGDYPRCGNLIDMDSPEGIRFDELFEAVSALKQSREAVVPVYDTYSSHRTGNRVAQPRNIVICDGFLLFHDPRIRGLFNLKIYMDIPIEVQRQRREARGRHWNPEYFDRIQVPVFIRYGSDAKRHADYVIDATKPLDRVIEEVKMAVRSVGVHYA